MGLGHLRAPAISAARHMPLRDRMGPRPLRSRDSPWEPLKYCSKKGSGLSDVGQHVVFVLFGVCWVKSEGEVVGLAWNIRLIVAPHIHHFSIHPR